MYALAALVQGFVMYADDPLSGWRSSATTTAFDDSFHQFQLFHVVIQHDDGECFSYVYYKDDGRERLI